MINGTDRILVCCGTGCIANGALNYNWPKYIMIAVMGLTTISLSLVMLVKSLKELRRLSRDL